MTASTHARRPPPADIWWSNAFFFIGVHVAACVGAYNRPPWDVPFATLLLAVATWQAACFAVTIGYHRLYSHRAFRAAYPVRIVLAALGSMAFQGSIKWWCLRHRLHHRFTDDPVHDPYAATRGLFYSHMGWIFYKPKYEKMDLINRDDLENDPVVRFQHKYYVLLALLFGFVLPTSLGLLWDDPSGAFVWGGLVSRLAIWHCTFLVNSLTHWDGLQPYSDENTSRGNFVMAVLTCGEGNHNFHAFPQDFRSGPSALDWDPSKWLILLLHRFGLATGLRRARDEDVRSAEARMLKRARGLGHDHGGDSSAASDSTLLSSSSSELESESEFEYEEKGKKNEDGAMWDGGALRAYVRAHPGRCVVLLDGYAVDVTPYLGEHPGGALLLRKYSVRAGTQNGEGDHEEGVAGGDVLEDASTAFHGGMNNHSRAARRQARELRVARVVQT
ncbi:hypothetical protein M0805_004137 [Coniferiporia weirii]|nr:hypothetical protein M0805_004137 [Coniferiporia weirii]